ncbi:UPF0462 protein C4orf33 homolog isoform X2 [Pleurodeles waltl]|uniref:UPF0462 protein C4orf33 homolog isoform X2 n=1 Tax=Pleurodeles waltl TaxID=8319 RepID=UPI0037099135
MEFPVLLGLICACATGSALNSESRFKYDISDTNTERRAVGAAELVYVITTTWDSLTVMHSPVTITFKPDENGLLMEVSAPFFDDPHAPPGEPGKPFNGLWDYEELDLSFEADTTSNWGRWTGRALIPWTYFPPDVDMMNSYAIHGSGIGRTYESLYPIPSDEIQEGQGPNFHRLDYFKEFYLKWVMGEDWNQPASELWRPTP